MFEVSHSIRPEKRSFGHFTDVGDEKFAVLWSEFTGILNILAGYFAAVLVDEVFVYDSYRFIDQIIERIKDVLGHTARIEADIDHQLPYLIPVYPAHSLPQQPFVAPISAENP